MSTINMLTRFSDDHANAKKIGSWMTWLALFVATLVVGPQAQAAITCEQTITANVVVFDSPTVFNRLGAQNPNWITYALKRDVVNSTTGVPCSMNGGNHCQAGNVELRSDKRPRPLVVRSVEGACLNVNFTNLLDPIPNNKNPQQGQGTPGTAEPDLGPFQGLDNNDQVAGRCASFHATGTELQESMADNGAVVGSNNDTVGPDSGPLDCGDANSGLVAPNDSTTYKLYTPHEGAFIISSYGATIGSEASSGNLAVGMFGALNVQPKGARIYRSQMTEEEMRLATTALTNEGQPIIDYEATYPNAQPWISEGKAGLPIVNMLTPGGELVHSDINAIIAGPDADGSWRNVCPGADCPYPLESVGKRNPAYPNRLEAFREFTSQYHDEQTNSQVFPNWYNNPVMRHVLHGVKDQFMINYGSGGIGSEIIANRLHTGPMHDCADCAYEEFFLASQTVGDPALLVNNPANTLIEACSPENIIAGPGQPNACWRDPNLANGPIAGNYALYQEDPSNVHHAYSGDFVKMRNTHAGSFEQHIFHFHNHQWLFNPNDDSANYLDAQEIMPGSGHTYELVNGGAGNRNKTVGDAIFHCHFYPHFAQGMWYHMRNHDVYETGTVLDVSGGTVDNPGIHTQPFALRSGKPMQGSRAYPDGELPDGSPIPAIVPLPGKPMPLMPAKVKIVAVDRGQHSLLGGRGPADGIPDSSQAVVDHAEAAGPDTIIGTEDDVTPGYPFWLAGNECGDVDFDTTNGVVGHAQCPMGIVGQRMPTPPLDMLTERAAAELDPTWANLGGGWDGGLPRHALLGYVSGGLSEDTNSRLDFRKVVHMAQPVYFPETGTDLEKVSMAYQAKRFHPSTTLRLGAPPVAGNFELNGAPAVPGGPFNDPCVDDAGVPLQDGWTDNDGNGHRWWRGDDAFTRTDEGFYFGGVSSWDAANPRTYKLANLQIDAVFNKVGYHYAQERIIILWEDVKPTVLKERPPEPLVMRFNSFDCGKILHANLVPHEFEVDDFQVRTPTDIIGQHIHLPKWDLTTNDGAANGWNYEDGTLSPGMVHERAIAINEFNHYAGELVGPNCSLAAVLAGDPDGLCPIPGQIAPIDLRDFAPVATLQNACGETASDPFSPPQSIEENSCGTPGGLLELNDHLPHYFQGFNDAGNPQVGAGMYKSARTTIQRILVDPVFNVAGIDRGLGLTFSHDHYGPSTFQQIGLYSTILAEPAGSTWVHNETGLPLNDYSLREDGGPTSWQAAILTDETKTPTVPDHREFYFEMSDFQHAYEAGAGYAAADQFGIPGKFQANGQEIQVQVDDLSDGILNATIAEAPEIRNTWLQAVNPTLKLTAGGGNEALAFPDTVNAHPNCPGRAGQNDPSIPRPCAEAINIGHSSMWVVNYRNEPVGLRVFDPSATGPDGRSGTQAAGDAGDLALAFQSRGDRAISALNSSFGNTPYPEAAHCNGKGDGINCDRGNGDPFTPIMRAYMNDHVKVKIQVGATEEQHQTTIHGMKWLSNGSGFGRSGNSGWRNFQSHGISEQFSLQVPITQDPDQPNTTVDYLYATDATRDGIWSGTWGILRAYQNNQNDLFQLPNNPQRGGGFKFRNEGEFLGVCPAEMGKNGRPTNRTANLRPYTVYAVLANDALGNELGVTIPDNNNPVDNVGGPLDPDGGTLVYNRRFTGIGLCDAGRDEAGVCQGPIRNVAGPLNDPTAMMYVLEEDLQPSFIPGESPDGTVGADGSTTNPYPADGIDDRCQKFKSDGTYNENLWKAGCPVELKPNVPVEPLVLRANAGDCIDVTLHNKLMAQAKSKASGKPVFTGTDKAIFSEVRAQKALDNSEGLRDSDGNVITSLAEISFDTVPDLAGWQDTFWVVNRDLFKPVNERNQQQMSFFGNNLIRPSAKAGMVAQLVDYDSRVHQGIAVGRNPATTLAGPGEPVTYRYYAGDISASDPVENGNQIDVNYVATPIEFGGTNLLSSDRIKQPQKGLFGALVIEPAGSTWDIDTIVPDGQGTGAATRPTRAQVTVTAPDGDAGSGGTYRESVAVTHKITNLRWADGTTVKNIHQGEFGVEGAEDSGHAGFNYGSEPSWFRFKLQPDADFGNAGTPNSFGSLPNPQAMYANSLVAAEPNAIPAITVGGKEVARAGDPQTPVFRAQANMAPTSGAAYNTRMHVLNGASADRDSTYILHGHVWPRDPFVCTGASQDPTVNLPGRCDPYEPVPSQALGLNRQAKYMGGEEGMGHVFAHWPILFNAGGTGGVTGDFLYRDYTPNGNRNGLFGILRVLDVDPANAPAQDTGDGGGGGGGGGPGGGKGKKK